MEIVTIQTDNGKVNFSKILIETLTNMALREIKGVVDTNKKYSRNKDKGFKRTSQEKDDSTSKEVRIEIKQNSVTINLYLVIYYGIRIPELTWQIQAKVKERIKELTGLEINEINVHIQGINYPKKYNNKNKLMIQGMFVKIF